MAETEKGFRDGIKETGFGNIVDLLKSITSGFSSLLRIISLLERLVSFLLKPIADVITVLLFPLLILLKPIAAAVREIMTPFTQLAFQAIGKSREAAEAGNLGESADFMAIAFMDVLSGLSFVLQTIFAQQIVMFSDVFLTLMLEIISLVIPISDEKKESVKTSITGLISGVLASSLNNFVDVIANLNNAAGLETTEFKNSLTNSINSFFGTGGRIEQDLMPAIDDLYTANEIAVTDTLNNGTGGLGARFKTLMGIVGKKAALKVDNIYTEYKGQLEI
jgi:hypothetical protein